MAENLELFGSAPAPRPQRRRQSSLKPSPVMKRKGPPP